MSKMNVPKLRFREFEGEWVEKFIGDILKIGSGKDYKHLDKGDIPVFGTGGYMTSVNNFLYDGDSVCIGRKGTIDKPMFLSGKFWTVDTLFFTHSFNNTIPRFVYLLFQRINWKKYNEASGVPSLSKKTIEKIKISLPLFNEQQKIANFLTSIDQKIEQLTKKEKLLVAYKKGIMQKIFSQEIRFRDENGEVYGDWVERKLGEVGIYISDGNYGEMYPKANEMKLSGIPFIRANNIKNLTLIWNDMKYIDEKLHNLLTSGHLQTNDILVTTRGDIGMLAYVKQEFNNANINAQICLLRCNESLNSFYLLQYLASQEGINQFKKFQTGSALKQLPKSSLKKIKFPDPCLSEQTKIANFLSSIDKKIEQINQQIEESKGFKKGLLQQMFV